MKANTLPLETPPPPSPISSADLHQGAAMRGDSQPIVIYVAEGSGVRVRGAGGGRGGGGGRWIRDVTRGDNLITAFYLLSSSSSALAALARPRHVTMVTWKPWPNPKIGG